MKQTTVYILLLLLTACQSKDRLDMALEYAGDNRKELEKVLEHYRGDEMKYRAARLLIENMVGHTGHDSTDVRKFQPFYDRHVAISKNTTGNGPLNGNKKSTASGRNPDNRSFSQNPAKMCKPCGQTG